MYHGEEEFRGARQSAGLEPAGLDGTAGGSGRRCVPAGAGRMVWTDEDGAEPGGTGGGA